MQKQRMVIGGDVIEAADSLTGNSAAAEAAAKAKTALDAIPVDRDALLLAERNDVLDHAIARLGLNGERWITGYLAVDGEGVPVDALLDQEKIDDDYALALRERGAKFCLVGAVGADLGPHSNEAVEQALSAVASVISSPPGGDYDYRNSGGYGFRSGGVFYYNDNHGSGPEIVYALQEAKKQPLRKD